MKPELIAIIEFNMINLKNGDISKGFILLQIIIIIIIIIIIVIIIIIIITIIIIIIVSRLKSKLSHPEPLCLMRLRFVRLRSYLVAGLISKTFF